MTGSDLELPNPPIVEAVVDIDCELPPLFDVAALERPAKDVFQDRYPNLQAQHVYQHMFQARVGDAPSVATEHGVQAWENDNLKFSGFVAQHSAVETATGHLSRVALATQAVTNGKLPVILDNCVEAPLREEPEWTLILDKISALRDLKNRVFRSMLTDECLALFQ